MFGIVRGQLKLWVFVRDECVIVRGQLKLWVFDGDECDRPGIT
jgi:hypothetical protein